MSVIHFCSDELGELAKAAHLCGAITDLREACEWLAIASLSNAKAFEVTYAEHADAVEAEAIYAAAMMCDDARALGAFANLRYNCVSNGGQCSIYGGEVEQWLERVETAIRAWQDKQAAEKERARLAAIPWLDTDETIKRLRVALKKATGRAWSVTRGRGTAYSWITIDAPKNRRVYRFHETVDRDACGMPKFVDVYDPAYEWGHMGIEDRQLLAGVLGLDRDIHHQGILIAPERETRWRYVSAAEEAARLSKPIK